MRLLDVNSVSEDRLPVFHELLENGTGSPLRYATLSHTWGKRQDNKDIIFDDIPSPETFARFFDEATQLKQWQTAIEKKKTGFYKVSNACRVAREMGMNYIWIDSCCIDKSKSAELNESINSMYRWYQNSELCIVYLEDLEPDGELRKCKWFKRGWTLQELVAPSKVFFYDEEWASLGERSHTTLCKSLSSITGIDVDYLQGGVDLGALSIAHRMSWANGRETTVSEDRAYSLIGIFDVNMPLIYGEGGSKAFQRLQEEIIKSSSDLSIFAWDPTSPAKTVLLDAFAPTPNNFTEYKDMVPSYQSQHFTRTNKGIEMKTILWRMLCADGKERLMLPIGKQMNGKHDVGIILRKLGHNMYMRMGPMNPFSEEQITSSTSTSTFYLVSPHSSTGYDHLLSTSRERAIMVPPEGLGDFRIENLAPEYAWDGEDGLFFNNQHWGGSDWRALELVKTGSASDEGLRLIALLVIDNPTPRCYLLRWGETSTLLFDRRHQTKTTRMAEFRYMIGGATNEIHSQSGAKWSLRLISESTRPFGMHFRLDLQEVPPPDSAIPSSMDPTASITSLLAYPAPNEVEWESRFDETAERQSTRKEPNAPVVHGGATARHYDVLSDGRPELANQSGKGVFSQFQITKQSLPGSNSRVGFAALSEISRKEKIDASTKRSYYRRRPPKPSGLYSLLSNWIPR